MSDLLTKRSVADIQHLIWLSLGGGLLENADEGKGEK